MDKQVKEMANDVKSYYRGSEYDELEDDTSFSEHLVNLGWIKPDETAVVLSMEEKDKTDKYITDLSSMIDNLRDDLKQARKETAREIFAELFYIASIHHSDVANILAWAKDKAKSCGVEV